MRMIYDSEFYVVVHHEISIGRHGFEIVDKRTNKELFLHDDWAGLFQAQINAWQLVTPEEWEVEVVLADYLELAQLPLTMH